MIATAPSFEERLRARARADRHPLHCLFEITPTCNLRCHFCYVAIDPYGGPYLSTDQAKRVLDIAADAGVLWMTLTGGEIFSRRDFAEIYRAAKAKGFLLTLFSNATMVTERIAALLKDVPPFAMEVSIYGADKEHYEATTGIPGSFDRFVRGVTLLQEAGVPLTLKTPFSVFTEDHADALFDFCNARGLPFRFDFSLGPRHDGGQQPNLYRIEPRRAASMQAAIKTKLMRATASSNDGPLEECSARPAGKISDELYQCGAGRIGFFVDALGNASHCVIDREPSFPLLEMEWSEIWTRIGQWVTQKLPEAAPCHGCSHRSGCNNCPARARLYSGSPYLKDPYFCDVTHAMHGEAPLDHPDYREMAKTRKLGGCIA